jgi:urease accessory protein
MLATLLALADSRLPAGAHAHSAGAEQAVDDGIVTDVGTLGLFLRRRLVTSGAVSAGLAAAAASATGAAPHPPPGLSRALDDLDAEADARMPLAATRAASRAQGRGLVRVARPCWPSPAWDALPRSPHAGIALGVAAAAGGASAGEAAVTAAYLALTGPATAAQRLLGLDPLAVAALLASLSADLHAVAADAAARAAGPAAGLAAETDVLADLLTARHTAREDRLFAS